MVTRSRGRFAIAVALLVVPAVACSTGDGRDLDLRVPASTLPPEVPVSAPSVPGTDAALVTLPAEPIESATEAGAADGSTFATVPEVGVPGLDAEDAFCAAWSRFAGSFQIVAVGAAFGEGSPEAAARLEVLASTTVDAAYADMTALWPDELGDERTAALERQYGPFATRVGGIGALLIANGASDAQLDVMSAAWFDALATRDPDVAMPTIELPAELGALVDRVAVAHVERSGSWFDDSSLASGVETPLTDAYLAATCPDQGTLGGQDADG